MDEITKNSLVKKLEELKKAKEDFLTRANLELASISGQIALLEDLLKEEPKE